MRALALLFTVSTLLAGCGASDVCSCDIIATDSNCVEFTGSTNPLYSAQLSGSCTSVLSGLCDSLGGTYAMGTACPTTDLVADCSVDVITYGQTDYYYSTGGSPFDASTTEPEDDCSGAGTVTRY